MLTLYDFMDSGNGYKVRLALAHLGLPYRLVECDILKGETRTPEFLAKNPNGRIPTLQLEDGTHLAESDAIIWYLAEGTALAPSAGTPRAADAAMDVLRAVQPRALHRRGALLEALPAKLTPLQEMELPGRMEKGYAALGVMEQHLAAPVLRRRPLRLGRHRALWLHPRRGRRRVQPRQFPARQRLAGAGRRAAGPRHHRPQELGGRDMPMINVQMFEGRTWSSAASSRRS